MRAALATELLKFWRARVPLVSTILLTAGIGVLCSSMLAAVHSSDPRMVAKLGALVDPGGWAGYLATASQITATAGLLGFGVVLSWLFGREFADGTITGLFALPVGRGTLAGAKLLVYAAWAFTISAVLVVVIVALGLALGLGSLPDVAAADVARQFVVTILTAAIALPAAWAATLGRGLLGGIGAIIGVVVVAQVAAVAGIGAWFPFAAPGLWAAGLDVTGGQLVLVVPVAAAFAAIVVLSWRRLQLDR
jgi:ABC-2 type transport system permease protein